MPNGHYAEWLEINTVNIHIPCIACERAQEIRDRTTTHRELHKLDIANERWLPRSETIAKQMRNSARQVMGGTFFVMFVDSV